MDRNSISLNIKIFVLGALFLICGPLLRAQDGTVDTTNRNNIIRHFIDIHSRNLFVPKASFYYLTYCDTVYYYQNVGDNVWDVTVYDELSVISFIGYDDYCFLDVDKKPNSFVRKGDVYYVWNDSNESNPELESILEDTGRIVSTEGMSEDEVFDLLMEELSIPCNIKATDFYFLRDNSKNYKMKVSSVALGYYLPPRITRKQKRVHEVRRVSTEEQRQIHIKNH